MHHCLLFLARRCAVMSVAVLMLNACTQSAEEVRASRSQRQERAAQPVVNDAAVAAKAAAAAADADMVAAVTTANTARPISLRFRLGARPEVGKQSKLELVMVPDSRDRIVSVRLLLQPSEGLAVVGAAEFDIGEVEAKARVQRELALQPLQPGVLTVTATAQIETDAESLTRIFTIPMIAVPAGG